MCWLVVPEGGTHVIERVVPEGATDVAEGIVPEGAAGVVEGVGHSSLSLQGY